MLCAVAAGLHPMGHAAALHIIFEIGRADPFIGYHAGANRRLGRAHHAESRTIRRKASAGDYGVALTHAGFLAFFEADIEPFGGIEEGEFITDDKTALLDGAEAPPVSVNGKKYFRDHPPCPFIIFRRINEGRGIIKNRFVIANLFDQAKNALKNLDWLKPRDIAG